MRQSSNRAHPTTQPSNQIAQHSMLMLCGFYFLVVLFLVFSWLREPGNITQRLIWVWLGLLSTGMVGWWLTRVKRVSMALVFVIGGAIIGTFLYPLLFSDGSIFTGIASLIVVFLVLDNILPQRQKLIFISLGALVSLLAIIFNYFVPVSISTAVSSTYFRNLTLVILSLGFIIYLDRFATYSLRFKLISTFLILSLIVITSIFTITIRSTQKELIELGNHALLSASRYTASALDSFIQANLGKISGEARSPVLVHFLSLDNEKRIETSTNLLAEFDIFASNKLMSVNQSSMSEFFIGYILSDINGQKIFDYPISMDKFADTNQVVIANTKSVAQAYVSPLLFPSDDFSVIYFASPVIDSAGVQVGILSMVYDGKVIQKIIQETNNLVGNRSQALLIDENQLILAQGLALDQIYRFTASKTKAERNTLFQRKQIPGTLADVTNLSEPTITLDPRDLIDSNTFIFVDQSTGISISYNAAVTGLKTKPWLVIYTQQQSQILSGLENQIRNNQPIVLGIVVMVAILALLVTQILTAPIDNLTKTAAVVAGGNLTARSNIRGRDEIGKLAETFNLMADRLQKSLSEMEARIKQRTFDLERRSKQLQVAADVGRAAATIHRLDELLNQVAVLISDRFNFYHVGIFLIDHAGEYAVLRASNSDGGKRMLARNHRLAIGHQGIVGYVASTGQARIALDVGEDAEYFNNPDLIHTRSEMALPLVSAGELLGVLDVQSVKAAAFTHDDLAVMQVLADLIAVAIENARLFAETQRSLEAMRRAYGDISRQAWLSRLEGNTKIAYRSYERGTITISDQIDQHIPISPQTISVPIKIRDTIIGYVDTYKPLDKGFWTEEENELLSAMVDQIGIALESARLYEASQTQAEKESLVSALSTKLQESLDVDTVLRTAAQEIRQSLGLSEVAVSLFSENSDRDGDGE